jgi:hypothetical protein
MPFEHSIIAQVMTFVAGLCYYKMVVPFVVDGPSPEPQSPLTISSSSSYCYSLSSCAVVAM